MLRIYKQNGELKELQGYERHCWINVTNPTDDEYDKLIKEYHVPKDFIDDILDIDERSRSEVDGRWLMIIIRIPVYVPKTDISFYTVPLGVLISPNLMITICTSESEIVNDILELKIKNFHIENKQNFVLHLFHSSSIYYNRFMKILIRRMNQIEKDIRKSVENSQLNILLKIQKCLVFFMTSLRSNELLLDKLQKAKYVNSSEIDEDLLEDLLIENKQALEMSKIHSEILTGMMDAFASVISNNINVVMKRLTTITICVMIPSVYSGFFGMNVPNIFQENPMAFAIIVISSIFTVLAVVLLFKKIRWF